jgi:hypothetical protein
VGGAKSGGLELGGETINLELGGFENEVHAVWNTNCAVVHLRSH